MSNQKTKKAVKLLVLLLTTSLLFSALPSYSQVDTSKIRKEISEVLKRNGIKSPSFELKVTSNNQKGGQTAYVINNYNGKNVHVVQGNNYGVNGDLNVNAEKELQEQNKKPLIDFIEKLKRDNKTNTNCITVWSTPNTNSSKMMPQIIEFLKSKGYNVEQEGQKTFVPMLKGIDVNFRNNCIEISVGFL